MTWVVPTCDHGEERAAEAEDVGQEGIEVTARQLHRHTDSEATVRSKLTWMTLHGYVVMLHGYVVMPVGPRTFSGAL